MTMVFYMGKSRFFKVGMDNTDQFEPLRLSLVVKQIIKNIDVKQPNARKIYVDNEKKILVEGIQLKIRLSEDHFEDIVNKKEIGP